MTTEKVDAWMPLWIGAYLADTMSLSRDSHGGYLLLLFAYWRNKGPLPDDDEDLCGITKATAGEWKKLRPRLVKFFTVVDGHWVHGRADKELTTAGLRKSQAVSKAKAAAEARWGNTTKHPINDAPSMPGALLDDVLDDCPTPSPLNTEPKGPVFLQATPGEACMAMKAAGMSAVSPSHPTLIALLQNGMTTAELGEAAAEAVKRGKPFGYALTVAENRRREAAAIAPLPGQQAPRSFPSSKYAAASAGIFGAQKQPEVIDV